VFTGPLPRTGHGADHTENMSRDCYIANPLAR
jgi:hypothetical protein